MRILVFICEKGESKLLYTVYSQVVIIIKVIGKSLLKKVD